MNGELNQKRKRYPINSLNTDGQSIFGCLWACVNSLRLEGLHFMVEIQVLFIVLKKFVNFQNRCDDLLEIYELKKCVKNDTLHINNYHFSTEWWTWCIKINKLCDAHWWWNPKKSTHDMRYGLSLFINFIFFVSTFLFRRSNFQK